MSLDIQVETLIIYYFISEFNNTFLNFMKEVEIQWTLLLINALDKQNYTSEDPHTTRVS